SAAEHTATISCGPKHKPAARGENPMQQSSTKSKPAWVEAIKPYQIPDHWKSAWQLLNSVVPYFVIWVLMYYSLSISYWLTLGLAFLNALFMMRIFIIQHDCGHNSFF